MKRQFLPITFSLDMEQKLQQCRQGSKSVMEYHLDFSSIVLEMPREVTEVEQSARFILGLNPYIFSEVAYTGGYTMEEARKTAEKLEATTLGSDRGKSRFSAAMGAGEGEDDAELCGLAHRSKLRKSVHPFPHKRKLSSAHGSASRFAKAPRTSSLVRTKLRCYGCQRFGHVASRCPRKRFPTSRLNACYSCGKEGHLSAQCPSLTCFKCGKPGHLWRDCSEKGTGRGAPPFKKGGLHLIEDCDPEMMDAYDRHLDEMQDRYDQYQDAAADSLEDGSDAEDQGNDEP
jgi:hypothetical protein